MSTAFPLLVLAAVIAFAVLLIRLDRRLSRGALSAGPRDPLRPEPVGLARTPWELQAVDDQLRSSSGQVRAELVGTVNRLIRAAGIDDPGLLLAPDASDHDIAVTISRLESRLELPPLGPGPPAAGPEPLGSLDR